MATTVLFFLFAGLAIGWIAVWIGAVVTGHKMRVQRREPDPGDGVIGVFPPEVARADADGRGSPNGVHGRRQGSRADSTVSSGGGSDDRDTAG